MFKRLSLAFAVICAGCQVLSPQESLQIARNSPDWELCYVAVSGKGQQTLRQAVYQVMRERSTDCNQHAAIVQAKLAQDAAKDAASNQAAWMLLQASQPRPAPPPTTTTCRTYNRGGYLQTVCD